MAQYFEVVGQINSQQSNDSIQYVITPQEISPQRFRAPQQIVVSNNQLMVLNQSPKQVIIDKTRQVAFQAQPEEFVIQDNVNFQTTGQQQVCYMDANSESIKQVVVEHPVVITTQMNNTPSKVPQQQQQVVQTTSLRTVRVPQQLANSRTTVVVGQSPNRMVLNRVQQQPRQQIQLNLQPRTPGSPVKVQRPANQVGCDGVTLPNGTIISYGEYKKLQQQAKLQNSVEKSPSTPRLPSATNNITKTVKHPPTPFPNQQPRFSLQLQQRIAQQQQRLQQQKLQQQKQQKSQANYLIQPRANQKPMQQRSLASFIPSSQIQQIIENTPMSEEYSDSIRMLVLLANGEQRLITFTLPKEACTIQEILEQVNVPFQPDTKIQVTEANSNGINYVVTVGNVPNINFDEDEEEQMECEDSVPQTVQQQQQQQRSPTPEPPKHVPKLIPGQLAVCGYCGYLSEDISRCIRCKTSLPDDVKTVPSANNKRFDGRIQLKKKKDTSEDDDIDKKFSKTKLFENETVVLSSDDENEEEKKQTRIVNAEILEKLGNSITISPITKEPSLREIQQHKIKVFQAQMDAKQVTTSLECRTIRIGSYRFVPPEKVYFDMTGIMIKVVHPTDKEVIPIRIERGNIVKVLASFNNTMPVIFYYLTTTLSETIRKILGMTKNTEYYFDPLDKQECNRRITLLPEEISEDIREKLKQIYTQPVNLLDELTTKEANDILIKICPKDLNKTPIMSYGEVKELLVYPPEGRVRIAINTEDYICLGTDQFLNDVIIDFYLKYIVDHLAKELREKVHVFSTFFYKRLTTKPFKATKKSHPIELDPNLSASEKRHARVKTWTKNIDLFEKDFIIVPINENAHWFLAIICYPNLNGCYTMDGNQPYKIEAKPVVKKKIVKKTTVGNVTIVQTEKSEKTIICDDGELSDKDEAEGDDSELDSDDSEASSSQNASVEVTPKVKTPRPAIKQPCILIFDSLLGVSRSRVVATLRDYLTCEYKAKLKTDRVYNKDNIKGACPKVPQQTNFTDCGLYLLQYVEQFFKDPIKDYYIPIAGLKNWFDEITVTKKREDISILIKNLMKEYKRDLNLVPEVAFPTVNGKLLEREEHEEGEEEEEDMFEDIGVCMHENNEETVENELPTNDELSTSDSNSPTKGKILDSPIKTSTKSDNKDFIEQKNVLIKPDICELPKTTTNRETLTYLKAKRIIRHKTNEGPDHKKVKSD